MPICAVGHGLTNAPGEIVLPAGVSVDFKPSEVTDLNNDSIGSTSALLHGMERLKEWSVGYKMRHFSQHESVLTNHTMGLAAKSISPDTNSGLEESTRAGAWWDRHVTGVTLVFAALLFSTLLLMAWCYALYRKFHHKSYLLEQSLDVANELVADIDEQRRQADRYLEVSKAMLVGLDRNGLIAVVNQATCTLLGYNQDELVGRDWFETCIPEDLRKDLRRIHLENLDTQGKDPAFAYYDNQVLTRQGLRLTIHWHNTLTKDDNGRTNGTLSSGIDVTQRDKTVRELLESREQFETLYNQFESLLHGISEPLLIIGHNLNLLWANRAAQENWFLSESLKQGKICNSIEMCQQLCAEGCIINKCFRENQELVHNYYHASGHSLKIRVFPASNEDGQPQSVIMMAQDVTEVLKHRTEMARASQLASVGELAANVAHEINNPLHGIINYADILKGRPNDPEFTRDIVTRIASEGERISLIVKNLLDFTRCKDDKPGPAALPMVIQSADILLGHKLKTKNIVVELDIPTNLPLIKGRSNQLQQVFINLFGNAYDALMDKEFAETDQRRILIRARLVDDMIEICCEDNGTGIPEAVQSRALEPFYTTKPVGKGTGLGLSISKTIIKEHGGDLWIETAEGEWTRVYFTLPRFQQSDIIRPTE
jgi:PAS domain S-box-containing protein